MCRIALFILFSLFYIAATFSQITLLGQVTDKEEGTPLEYVMVTLKDKNSGTILGYSQTATDGSFAVKVNLEIVKKSSLHFSLMGYREEVRSLSETAIQTFDIAMEMSEVQLKEVVIKSRKIWEQGDTIVYSVSNFATEQDRTIGDVLKKMPGFDVQKDGRIYYNGKSINKFYIEGRDMLEGRYGIATNGVPQRDVGRVEVMENHQPVRALEGFTLSDQAAVNLKMKDKSKAKWIATIDGGAGVSESPQEMLWDGKLFAMMIKSVMQNISTTKSNNIGEDYAGEMRDFSSSTDMSGNTFFRVGAARIADLEKERTMFNRSHFVSSSSLWGLSKETELKTQIHYLNHHETSRSLLASTYYLPDGTKLIEEEDNSLLNSNHLAGVISLETNNKSAYLKNILKTDLKWANTDVITQGAFANNQFAKTPVYRVQNALKWVKRLKTKAFTLISINELQSEPHLLTVERNGMRYEQQANLRRIYTHEETSFGWSVNRFVFSLKAGIKAEHRELDSELSGLTNLPGLLSNNEKNTYFHTFAGPELVYNYGKWRARLNVPLSYYHYRFTKEEQAINDLLLSPSLGIYWDYSGNLKFYTSAALGEKPYMFNNRYQGLILNNYRTLQQGTYEYATGSQKMLSSGFNYKNTSQGLFASLNINRIWNIDPYRNIQQFVSDDFRIYTSTKQETKSNSWLGNASFSVSLDFIRGMAGIDVQYFNSSSLLIAEKQTMPYRTEMCNIEFNANGQLVSWINWSYRVAHNLYTLSINKMDKNTLHGWQHNIVCNIVPTKRWTVQLSGEYYRNEVTPNTYKNLVMANAKSTYKISNRLELSLQLKNLLNHQQYAYTVYNNLSSIKQEHGIRGREFLIGFSWR